MTDLQTTDLTARQRRISPIGDMIFVAKDEGPEKIGMIWVPHKYRPDHRETYHRAVVKAVGPGRWVTCPYCAYGYSLVPRSFGGEITVSCPVLERSGWTPALYGRVREWVVEKMRAEVRRVMDHPEWTAPPRDCKNCGGSGQVRFRSNVLKVGDVVFISEHVSGKGTIDPVALDLEEQLGNKPVFVVTSHGAGLLQEDEVQAVPAAAG